MQVANLNITPGSTPPRIHVSQGDVGRQFKLILFDPSSDTIDISSDASIAVSGTKPDHHAFSYTDTQTTFSGNEIIVTTTYQMTACSGDTECEIRIIEGSSDMYSIYTCNFVLDVEKASIPDDADLSASDIPKMNQVIEAMDKIDMLQDTIDNAERLADEIAEDVTATRQNAEAARAAEVNAKASAEAAKISETNAKTSETNTKESETAAKESETNAKTSETSAKTSEINASKSAEDSKDYSTLSKSWAVGGTGTRNGEDTNNSKYYSEQTEAAVEKVATITQYTLLTSNWSSSTTAVNGTYYYTYEIGNVTIISEHPEYMVTSNNKLPSDAEQEAFDSIRYMYAENSTLTFYAQNKPTIDIMILVRGVK